MEKFPLAAVVNFCTNESRFLRPCLEQVLSFSGQVIVPVCDHFFDGTMENRILLDAIYASFPSCFFIEYPFVPKKIPRALFKKVDAAHFWHSLSRLVGASFLKEEIESVLFLDADEVIEGEKMIQWLETSAYQPHTALKLANYWYFREPKYQALQWEDSPILLQKKALSPEVLLHTEERQGIYDSLPGPKRRMVPGTEGVPIVHHYSWVRTEEEMLKKVQTWGHRADRDWTRLVKEEFSHPFQGTDFVHGYAFREVAPPFQISFHAPLFPPQGKPHVHRLTGEDVLKFLKFARQDHPIAKWLHLLWD